MRKEGGRNSQTDGGGRKKAEEKVGRAGVITSACLPGTE